VVAIWPYLKLIARNIMFFSVGLLLAVVIINSLFKACFGKSEQNCNIVKYPNFDLVIFHNILRKFGLIWLFFIFDDLAFFENANRQIWPFLNLATLPQFHPQFSPFSLSSSKKNKI